MNDMARVFVWGAMFLFHSLGPTAVAAGVEILTIADQKQLFIDDHVIEFMEPGVYQILNQPEKYYGNPVIPLSTPWEQGGALSHIGDGGNVFYDHQRGLFRFYGLMINWDVSERWLFYAESSDGIHWVKPKLGQVEYLGHVTNFIALPFTKEGFTNAVFQDPAAKNEQEKYKMIYFDKRDGKRGMYPAHSPDGIHWTGYEVDRPAVAYWSDTNNNLIWDAQHNRYMLYLRTSTPLEKWFDPEPIYPKGARTRTPAWASSPDFLHWDAPQDIRRPEDRYICFHADAQDRIGSRDFYTLEVLPYEGAYVGFTSVYHNMFGVAPAGMDSGKAQSPWLDRINVQLLWSRDGKKFERVGQRRIFIPNGPEGSWDADLIYTVQAPIVREDRGEIWIYYEGFGGHHWFYKRGEHQRGQIGLAILRLDGFVSVTGRGALTTKPLLFEGNRLTINATGVDKYAGKDYGTVCVEILKAATDQPIPGFSKGDCDVFGGDEIRHTVTWKGQADLSNLKGKSIKLKFHLDKAKLFSFQFVEAE